MSLPLIILLGYELEAITGYKRAKDQQKHFDALGVPSRIRPDNTLSVIRYHLLRPPGTSASSGDRPKRVRVVRKAA